MFALLQKTLKFDCKGLLLSAFGIVNYYQRIMFISIGGLSAIRAFNWISKHCARNTSGEPLLELLTQG